MPENPDPVLWRIMEDYRRAWERQDAELLLSLFTEDATYHENPFNEPLAGLEAIRAYWRRAVMTDQKDIRFRWRPVYSIGEEHAIEWEAQFLRRDPPQRVELRGMMFLTLSGKRIARLREYWHKRETSA
ncbi:MAG TPA: nuclear transport factor 2 family protein [Candidatus Acidoferrales bacterium]|nr:nuclear transport factor 2 family protein [Candidatus Acidoferrales bacterium]